MMIQIPTAILALDQRLTSGRLTAGLSSFAHRAFYGKHPTVLIFFVLLLSVSEFMYLPGAWPRLSLFQKVTGSIAIILPYWFLYLAAFSDPGNITPATHARYMSQYPYDFSLFHPGQVCRTCQILKPARSKHCSVCKRCVAKMDHHCVFINNCVGYNNQAYFVLLLLTTGILTCYAALLGLNLISAKIRLDRADWAFWKPTLMPWHEYFILLTFGIQDDVGLGSVTMLTLMTSPLVWGLLAYHVYLIYCGTTTNESMKWQDWKAEMDDGFAYKRSLPSGRTRDPRWEAAWTRWPVESVQVLVRTDDGSPPSADDPLGVGDWERVWSLRDIENLYDLGFWDNLVDVFVPGYSFRDEVMSDVETGRNSRLRKARKGKAKNTPVARVVDAAT